MSKAAPASTPKIPTSQPPTKSAWTRGPPLSTVSSSTPRSQSPSSANATQPSTPTHSRKPSALGGPSAPNATFRDGVSVPRSIQPPQKPTAGLSFGSIAEPSAPLSSSPVAVPALSSDASNVKSFGTIPASNGVPVKPALIKTPSKSTTSTMPSSPSPTPATKPKLDVKSLFMNGSGASNAQSPTVSNATEASPAQRPAAVPSAQIPSSSQTFYPQRPNAPSSNTNTSTGGPRSPQYSRQVNMPGSTGRNVPPNSASLGPSSPRLSSIQVQHPQHPSQPPMTSHPVPLHPHVQPGMPVTWAAPPYYFAYNVDHHYAGHGGPFPWQTNSSQSIHPPPPHTPTHAVASPARPPPPILHGAPPAVPPATPPTTNSPYPPPPQAYSYPQSPPPPGTPQTPSSRLSTQAPAFVPKQRMSSAIKIRNPENGEAVDLSSVAPPLSGSSEPTATSATPVTLGHQRKSTVIRMESEETHNKRMEEQRAKEQEKAEQELVARRQRDHEEKIRKRKEEEAERKRKEEEVQRKREEEVQKRREEEAQKKRKEEEAQKKREEEVEQRRREEEEARKRKEEEECRKQEEEERERLQKEKEEREEKERIRKEEEERERLRREERDRLRQHEEETKHKKEEEAAKAELAFKALETVTAVESLEGAALELGEEKETDDFFEDAGSPAPSLTAPSLANKVPPSPFSSIEPTKTKRPVPGPLDLSATSKPGLPPPLPSALATARAIDDLDKIQYPEGILSPKPELNAGGSRGKFRYDRDFLLQFMAICKDKPDSMPALDAIGLEPDQAGSSRTRNNSRSSMGPPPSLPGRSGIGLGGPLGAKAGSSGPGFMGQFGIGSSKLSSSEAASMGRSASLGGPASSVAFPRATPMVRTASQGGTTPSQPSSLNPTGRTRSQRGGKHRDTKGGGVSAQERERTISMAAPSAGSSEPVEPLKTTENRWTPMSALKKQAASDTDSSEVVERKVKALLNKLTMEKFDSISDQIIAWANKSEKEKDGRTLIQVIRLVFEKATDEAAWSEMYARLCRKMMEQISQNVQDDGIRSADGKPIAGGLLFRKYLLNRCQEDFERGWSMKEAAAKAAESKAADDRAVKDAADKAEAAGKGSGEDVLYSEEYYAAQKAKRRGLGLVKFIGELFKLQMLTERIMHECIKKLLGNVENPEEEEIESLCKLLSTVGRQLDTDKARSHMDVYFQRMKELSKSLNITSRMQFMLLDVLELRERKWVARNAQAAPTTIAAVHEQAAKDQAKAQSEQSLRSLGQMSRGGSRRGEQRSSYNAQTADGWTSVSAARPTSAAGDLTQFGKISKGPVTSFGPGSVFANKNKDSTKGRDGSMSRTSSTSNMFAMLNSDAATDPPAITKSSRPPSRKPSADFTQTGIPEPSQRKKLALLPRTKPVPGETKMEEQEQSGPDEEQINSRIEEDIKEFWAVRDLDEADTYFPNIPVSFRARFVDKLVASALERKETDARLLAQFLSRAGVKGDCPPPVLEEGFLPHIQNLDDIAIDAPAAYRHMAILLKGADLPKTKVEELAEKIVVDGDPLVHPRDKLLREYDNTDP